MTKPTVLLIGNLDHTYSSKWSSLSSKFNLKEYSTGDRATFLRNCKNGDYDDVTGLYRSNVSTAITGPFDQELVNALPSSLKYICHNGAGYDNINVRAVTEKGIAVSSTPGAVNDATADVAIFLMLGALRMANVPIDAVRAGAWRGKTQIGRDPRGKVLGILGMGGIGRAVAQRARSFGMEIIYHNRSRLSGDLEHGAKYVSFDELLANSDILSLNLSLNAKTRHIISAPEFQKMKDGVVIVNTARGALMNERELVAALKSGKVGSVGLDVFENEPKIEPELLQDSHAFILPHIGTNTYETQKEMELLVLKNLEQAVEGRGLITQIPEQVHVMNGNGS